MNNTTVINNPEESREKKGKKLNKKNLAGYAGTAVGSAAAGAAAVYATNAFGAEPAGDADEEIVAEAVQTQDTATPQADASQAPSASNTSSQQQGGASTAGPTEEEEVVAEVVNPDEVAEAIIAEEQIDPRDIDMEDVINFDEIGTIYTVEGESYTAATFHDAYGNEMVMVDLDGDNTFDVIADSNGNIVAEAPNLTVDDAEIDIMDNNTYLAHDDTTDDFGADTIADDIIA